MRRDYVFCLLAMYVLSQITQKHAYPFSIVIYYYAFSCIITTFDFDIENNQTKMERRKNRRTSVSFYFDLSGVLSVYVIEMLM